MSRLDDPGHVDAVDSQGFLHLVEQFPEQIVQAWRRSKQLGPVSAEGVESIAVLGVGGSGISGNVLKTILGPSLPMPVEVCKGYEIPGWVGPRTLAFAVSYSGETEETLETFEKARAAGAQLVTVSTGGTLSKLGEMHGYPGALVQGGLQPRAALGHLVFSMLGICQGLGLGDFEREVDETVALLARRYLEWGRTSPLDSNLAKTLAEDLLGTVPVIYGSEGLGAVAAYRWKCQLNECSKVNAYSNFFSELNHNEVMGWSSASDNPFPVGLVVLRHAGEHPRIRDRIKVTLALMGDRPRVVREVDAEGASPTVRLMDLIHLGDYVATYLAIARGVDPCSVDLIDQIKRELLSGTPEN
jgi:glucose/mannose-6-phosphate isomerase